MNNSDNYDTNYQYTQSASMQSDPIVSFNNADTRWMHEILSNRDPTYMLSKREDGDLGAFLSRPVKIYSATWSTGVGFSAEIDPWSLFLNNLNVNRRIENYYLLRGDLDLKIMINGNPFYYGRMLVSYNPLSTFRLFDALPGEGLYVYQASQRPHIFLDPTTSTGGNMCVPYFYPKNWVSLPYGEYDKLGTLSFTSIADLQHANSAAGSVNIVVFASMKNVELTIPTINGVGTISPESGLEPIMEDGNIELTPILLHRRREHFKEARRKYQRSLNKYLNARMEFTLAADNLAQLVQREYPMLKPDLRPVNDEFCRSISEIIPESGRAPAGKKKSAGKLSGSSSGNDEYGKGIISKPASILAKAAGALSNVPTIGPYAMASKYALDGIANVARIFGYSRPPVVSEIVRYKPLPAGIMANVDMDEAVVKLSLDTKQELTIDPSTVGLEGTDQMSFSHILQKESLFSAFQWEESDASEDVLGRINVTPAYFRTSGAFPGIGGSAVCMPMTLISQLFKHWRGSIVFRFQIVASAYHKGRLRITYDPYSCSTFPSEDYNVAYNRVIDLAEERDFELTVNWAQPEAWKEVPGINGLSVSQLVNVAGLLPLPENTNGMLQLAVINELTTPNTALTRPVQINVFVRGGPDLEFANPTDGNIDTFSYGNPSSPEDALGRGASFIGDDSIKPESGEETTDTESAVIQGDGGDDTENSPVGVEGINAVGGLEILPSENSLMIYMGEKVTSLRSLFKRYNWHQLLAIPGSNNSTVIINYLMNFPAYRGYALAARTVDAVAAPYNYVNNTYMTWCVPAFLGWRGGIRWKYHNIGLDNRTMLTVSRDTSSIEADGQTQTVISFRNKISPWVAEDGCKAQNGRAGALATQCSPGGVSEVELPFYSEFRFAHTHDLGVNHVLTNKPNGFHHAVEAWSQYGSTEVTQALIRTSCAVGEDFSCFWFINCPTFYSYDDPPAPTS
jgi:hypothetical protein